jgi:hypothetical protein
MTLVAAVLGQVSLVRARFPDFDAMLSHAVLVAGDAHAAAIGAHPKQIPIKVHGAEYMAWRNTT